MTDYAPIISWLGLFVCVVLVAANDHMSNNAAKLRDKLTNQRLDALHAEIQEELRKRDEVNLMQAKNLRDTVAVVDRIVDHLADRRRA